MFKNISILVALLAFNIINPKSKIIYISYHAELNSKVDDLHAQNSFNGLFFPTREVHKIAKKAAKKLGYSLVTDFLPQKNNQIHAIVLFSLPSPNMIKSLLKNYTKRKLVLFIWEPPVVDCEIYNPKIHQLFDKIFTWHDDLIDNKKYFKFLYAQSHSFIRKPLPFNAKKFCCLMAGNKFSDHPDELYTARKQTINFFKTQGPSLDLYGPGWEQLYSHIHKGIVPDKIQALRNYKFCICYENMKNIKGYITEKIQHCFFAGCVPIYWGASNILNYVPQNCFIDRNKFTNEAELYKYLTNMPEEEYQQYIENIQTYLKNDHALLFSPLYFAECLLRAIIPHYNRQRAFDEEQSKSLENIDDIIKNVGHNK